MVVQLMLAAGSRAGTVANIQPGDDLIGSRRIRGAAWQEADIAAFLEEADDADRMRGDETIRSRRRTRVDRVSVLGVFGYQCYRFQSRPEPRGIESPD